MSNTTRWRDTQENNLDALIGKIVTRNGTDFFEQDDSSKAKYKNVIIDKKFGQNEKITLNGREVEFNYIEFSFDKVTAEDTQNPLPEEDRTVKNEGFLILYNDGIKNNYIINKNSGAMSLLRHLIGYKGRGEISSNRIEMTSDLIIWLISKVYLEENSINSGEKKLEIESVIGFKGDTEDLLSTVTADGDSVMNILSTLSFILESKSLKQVKIRLSYSDHKNIELKLGINGTLEIDSKKYDGVYESQNRDLTTSRLLLLVYIVLLPMLKQWYVDEASSQEWGKEKYKEFLSQVAENLKEKIDNKIQTLT